MVYGNGEYDLTKKEVGTRYVRTSVRTLVDPGNPDDLEQVHALQDAIAVSSRAVLDASTYRTGIRSARRKCATC